MVRVSSTFSSKPAFATSLTLVITVPVMIALWLFELPTPWQLSGADEYFQKTTAELGKYSSLSLQYALTFAVVWPLAFIYSFYSIPSRLIICEEGLRVKDFGRETRYTFEQVKGIKFTQGENNETFLKLKLRRRWYTFEVGYGQARDIHKYLPTYLTDEPPNSHKSP